MPFKSQKLSAILLLLVLSLPLTGQNISRSDNSLNAENLIHDALVASGTNPEKIKDYLERIETITASYKEKISGMDFLEAAEYTLSFMYPEYLAAYGSRQTKIDVLLDTKNYNCVSSAIFYLYLMKIAGIQCTAIETPDHAFCEITVDGKNIRIETTNPYGFNPGTKKESTVKNQYYTVPAKYYLKKKPVSDRRAVSMIYTNRISDLTKIKKNTEAYILAEENNAYMENTKESMDIVQSCVVNVLSDFHLSHQYDEGIAFARDIKNKYGLSQKGLGNAENLVKLKAWELEDAGNYQDLYPFLESNTDILGEATVSKLTEDFLQRQIKLAYQNEGFDSACLLLNSPFSQKKLSVNERSNLENNFKTNEANQLHNQIVPLFNAQKFPEVREILIEGINRYGNVRILTSDLSMCIQGEIDLLYDTQGYDAAETFINSEEISPYLTEKERTNKINNLKSLEANKIHNKAVPLVNSGNYEEAKKLIEEGIEKYGNQSILVNDLNRLKKKGF